MNLRHLVSGALALSVLGVAAAPALAQEGPPPPPPGAYDRDGGHYYDPCHRDTVNRGTGGAVVGALAGAVVGSQVAASGHRTDGSLVGGVLGALVGNKIGRDSAACDDQGYGYRRQTYYGGGYRDGGYGYGYGGGWRRERVYRDDGYGYRGDGYRAGYRDGRRDGERDDDLVMTDRPADQDGCRLAESPVYMPNGEVQKRYVRVCPDAQGHYQVVD
jgi:hypothetical protein